MASWISRSASCASASAAGSGSSIDGYSGKAFAVARKQAHGRRRLRPEERRTCAHRCGKTPGNAATSGLDPFARVAAQDTKRDLVFLIDKRARDELALPSRDQLDHGAGRIRDPGSPKGIAVNPGMPKVHATADIGDDPILPLPFDRVVDSGFHEAAP